LFVHSSARVDVETLSFFENGSLIQHQLDADADAI
jgi:hypothetical protein